VDVTEWYPMGWSFGKGLVHLGSQETE